MMHSMDGLCFLDDVGCKMESFHFHRESESTNGRCGLRVAIIGVNLHASDQILILFVSAICSVSRWKCLH